MIVQNEENSPSMAISSSPLEAVVTLGDSIALAMSMSSGTSEAALAFGNSGEDKYIQQ